MAPSALSEAVTRADADPTIGLCGSTLVYYHDRGSVQAFGGARFNRCTGRSRHVGAFASTESIPADPQRTEQAMSYVIGAAMLVRREYIEQVGMMQDDYFLYYEEIDWATRGKSQFRLGYAPASIVYHKEGASIGTTASGGSALSMYFLFRNRIRFTARFHAWMLPMVVVTCCWDVFKLLAKGRMTAANAALRGMLMRPRTAVSTRA